IASKAAFAERLVFAAKVPGFSMADDRAAWPLALAWNVSDQLISVPSLPAALSCTINCHRPYVLLPAKAASAFSGRTDPVYGARAVASVADAASSNVV